MQSERCIANAALSIYDHIVILVDTLIFAAGVFVWTLLEYVIHGVLGHTHRTFVSGLHEVHHRDPRAVFALGSWLPVAVVIGSASWIFGAAPGVIFLGGVAAGFAGYEFVHYRIHFSKPSCALEERLLRLSGRRKRQQRRQDERRDSSHDPVPRSNGSNSVRISHI